MTTDAPSMASRRADAVPMPGSVEAPVTMATFPPNRRPNVLSSTGLLRKGSGDGSSGTNLPGIPRCEKAPCR